jgi:membrane protein DedA with SNARE-associated domain
LARAGFSADKEAEATAFHAIRTHPLDNPTVLQHMMEQAGPVIDFVKTHRAWAAPIVFMLAFGESLAFVSLILPFWAILVGIGTLVTVSGLDFWSIWIAASIGAALGDWLSYWIGAHFQHRIAGWWPLSKVPDMLPRGEALFKKWGCMAVVIGRFSGPLRATVPLAAGLTHMPILQFQLANFGSAFLWAGVLLTPGGLMGRYLPA